MAWNRPLSLAVGGFVFVAAAGYVIAPPLGGGDGGDVVYVPAEVTGKLLLEEGQLEEGQPEPTKDNTDFPTITPSMKSEPTREPSEGVYFGLTPAEVAEAVCDDYAATSDVPISIVTFAEIHPDDGEPLGIPAERIADFGEPDVAVVLSGAFHSLARRPTAEPEETFAYALIVVDLTYGGYSFKCRNDVNELLSMLP